VSRRVSTVKLKVLVSRARQRLKSDRAVVSSFGSGGRENLAFKLLVTGERVLHEEQTVEEKQRDVEIRRGRRRNQEARRVAREGLHREAAQQRGCSERKRSCFTSSAMLSLRAREGNPLSRATLHRSSRSASAEQQ